MQEFYKQYISWAFDRLPEGYMSWQHLLTVSMAFALVVFLAIFSVVRTKRNHDQKN